MGNIIISYLTKTGHDTDRLLFRFDNDKEYARDFVYISWTVYELIMNLERDTTG